MSTVRSGAVLTREDFYILIYIGYGMGIGDEGLNNLLRTNSLIGIRNGFIIK